MKRVSWIVLGILVFVTAASGFAYDRGEFLFLDEIEIGMKGIGKTVVADDVISEFGVEVLGVIDEPSERSDFIVVRVSGEAIGRSGGIAQGMSGSPIYVDEKLIGALSRAATWSKEITPIGLVTPIEGMLGVIDSVRDRELASRPTQTALLSGIQLTELNVPPDERVLAGSPNTIFSYPVSSPLLVTGLTGRALEVLMNGVSRQAAPEGLLGEFFSSEIAPETRGLSSFGLRLAPVLGQGRGNFSGEAVLEPGSGIGIALASGDVSIGALGTLTFRDGEAVVGFGHPFLANGEAAFPLTTVHIYDTLKAYDASFKLGTIGERAGAILEDRMPGIGGLLGRSVSLIDLSLGVFDLDSGRTEHFQIDLVDEPRIMGELLLATSLEATDATLDRIGQGTVEVTYQILGDGMPFPLERRDVFISTRDIAIYPPWQLANIVSLLQYNAFQDPQVTRVATAMQVTHVLKAIRINHLEIDQDIYAPGESIHYTVELQTYHDEKQTIQGEINIPDDLIADTILVRAYGGPRPLESGESPEEFEDLGDLIEAIEELPSYDILTVELFVPDPYLPYVEALQGVEEVTTEFAGYFLYDSREVRAFLYEPE